MEEIFRLSARTIEKSGEKKLEICSDVGILKLYWVNVLRRRKNYKIFSCAGFQVVCDHWKKKRLSIYWSRVVEWKSINIFGKKTAIHKWNHPKEDSRIESKKQDVVCFCDLKASSKYIENKSSMKNEMLWVTELSMQKIEVELVGEVWLPKSLCWNSRRISFSWSKFFLYAPNRAKSHL